MELKAWIMAEMLARRIVLIVPFMELKGLPRQTDDCRLPSLNRTFYGIESEVLFQLREWQIRVLIVPFMELKDLRMFCGN